MAKKNGIETIVLPGCPLVALRLHAGVCTLETGGVPAGGPVDLTVWRSAASA